MEEEELSEMQLRLLALQSASKKWHQKEQQVMKESKERITKASQVAMMLIGIIVVITYYPGAIITVITLFGDLSTCRTRI